MGQRCVRVYSGPSFVDRPFADVGGENLKRKTYSRLFQEFGQADGDRISFLACRAPRHPDANRILGPSILNQSGEHPLLQFLEDRRLPKEGSHRDQKALAQLIYFLGVPIEIPAVVCQPFESSLGYAPLDAPLERALLVLCEIYSRSAAH